MIQTSTHEFTANLSETFKKTGRKPLKAAKEENGPSALTIQNILHFSKSLEVKNTSIGFVEFTKN